jgi:hypothetical protein
MENSKKISEVSDHEKFIQTEVYAMNLHVALSRTYGDNRSENEIVLEWIQDNAESFRSDFVMAY